MRRSSCSEPSPTPTAGSSGATTRRSATRSWCRSTPDCSSVNVRVNVPGEGPRAQGKLIRWNRVQTGELAVEIQGGHRLINFQIESNVLRGEDEEADVLSEFVLIVYDAIDGRSAPPHGRSSATAAKGPIVTPARRTQAARRRNCRPRREPAADRRASSSTSTASSWTRRSGGTRSGWRSRPSTAATWTADDQAAVMGANSRGLGADHARAARPRRCRSRTIERAIVDGVVDAVSRARAPRGSTARSRPSGGSPPTARSPIASSAHADVIDAALAATGLADVFEVVVSSDEVAHGKPAPDVYLEVGAPARRRDPARVPRGRGLAATASGPARPPG